MIHRNYWRIAGEETKQAEGKIKAMASMTPMPLSAHPDL